MRTCVLLLSVVCLLVASFVGGQEAETESAKVVAKVKKAAQNLIATLDKKQKDKLLFAFEDEQQKRRWSNLPTGIVERKGLRMGDLTKKQKQAVLQLIRATLSKHGYQQVIDNMEGDDLLKPPPRLKFGKDEYYVSILGEPSGTKPWMWQFGGHHLAINATIVGDKITLSPTLTGGQPVDFKIGDRSVRQLGKEEDLAFELINSFSADRKKQAVLGNKYVKMRYGPGKEGAKPQKEGIKASTLNKKQQKLLLALINERISILNEVHAKPQMKTISEQLDSTWFSWYGPTQKGSAATFRIQGPSILMEYSPQRLGGDPTQHTHAMYRDPTNDYGVGFLKAE